MSEVKSKEVKRKRSESAEIGGGKRNRGVKRGGRARSGNITIRVVPTKSKEELRTELIDQIVNER